MPEAPTPAAYEELLDLAGFFGAQTGSPSTAITVTNVQQLERHRDKNLLLLGDAASQLLLSRWSFYMPLEVTPEGWQVNAQPTPSRLLHSQWPFRDSDRRRLISLLKSGISPDLVVESFLSPYRQDRTVVALVPRERNNSDAVASMFIPSEHQGPIYGGVAISKNRRFQSFLVGTVAYRTGNLTPFEETAVLLFESYWLIPGLVVLCALMIGIWLHQRTERIAARRLTVNEV
jgi:Bacterial cellulose synthase subunit